MRFGTVAHIDKPISRIVLGSVPFKTSDLPNTFAILDAYMEAGGNTIDLSHIYSGGDCHRALGEYIKERHNRDNLILFDKGCHHWSTRRVSREALRSDITDNHKNLGVEHTDFFVLHRDDPLVPIGNIVDWLNEEKDADRISAFGGSNFHHSRIRNANKYAAEKGVQGFSVSSPNLSLAIPNEPVWTEAYAIDRIGRDWHEETQFPLFSWSSGGGGFFAKIDSPDVRRVYHNKYNWDRMKRVEEFAKKFDSTPTAVALAWTLSQPMNVFALIGPANAEQLKDNLRALELTFGPDELHYLEHGAR